MPFKQKRHFIRNTPKPAHTISNQSCSSREMYLCRYCSNVSVYVCIKHQNVKKCHVIDLNVAWLLKTGRLVLVFPKLLISSNFHTVSRAYKDQIPFFQSLAVQFSWSCAHCMHLMQSSTVVFHPHQELTCWAFIICFSVYQGWQKSLFELLWPGVLQRNICVRMRLAYLVVMIMSEWSVGVSQALGA